MKTGKDRPAQQPPKPRCVHRMLEGQCAICADLAQLKRGTVPLDEVPPGTKGFSISGEAKVARPATATTTTATASTTKAATPPATMTDRLRAAARKAEERRGTTTATASTPTGPAKAPPPTRSATASKAEIAAQVDDLAPISIIVHTAGEEPDDRPLCERCKVRPATAPGTRGRPADKGVAPPPKLSKAEAEAEWAAIAECSKFCTTCRGNATQKAKERIAAKEGVDKKTRLPREPRWAEIAPVLREPYKPIAARPPRRGVVASAPGLSAAAGLAVVEHPARDPDTRATARKAAWSGPVEPSARAQRDPSTPAPSDPSDLVAATAPVLHAKGEDTRVLCRSVGRSKIAPANEVTCPDCLALLEVGAGPGQVMTVELEAGALAATKIEPAAVLTREFNAGTFVETPTDVPVDPDRWVPPADGEPEPAPEVMTVRPVDRLQPIAAPSDARARWSCSCSAGGPFDGEERYDFNGCPRCPSCGTALGGSPRTPAEVAEEEEEDRKLAATKIRIRDFEPGTRFLDARADLWVRTEKGIEIRQWAGAPVEVTDLDRAEREFGPFQLHNMTDEEEDRKLEAFLVAEGVLEPAAVLRQAEHNAEEEAKDAALERLRTELWGHRTTPELANLADLSPTQVFESAAEVIRALADENRKLKAGLEVETIPRMRRVIVESPYKSGDVRLNEAYARRAMADCLRRGEAPFASHLLYTQPGVLRDEVEAERNLGIEAGLVWGAEADATVVYADLGVSGGMVAGIDRAKAEGRPVEVRQLAPAELEAARADANRARGFSYPSKLYDEVRQILDAAGFHAVPLVDAIRQLVADRNEAKRLTVELGNVTADLGTAVNRLDLAEARGREVEELGFGVRHDPDADPHGGKTWVAFIHGVTEAAGNVPLEAIGVLRDRLIREWTSTEHTAARIRELEEELRKTDEDCRKQDAALEAFERPPVSTSGFDFQNVVTFLLASGIYGRTWPEMRKAILEEKLRDIALSTGFV